MKLNVYQEQYKSKQAAHNPGAIGFGYSINSLKDTGNALIKFAEQKVEQDDMINSARIEADTLLAANKMYREYQNSANPDTFGTDIETQKNQIQDLILSNSKRLKTAKYQTQFRERMTSSLETKYMSNVLNYGYIVQEEHYKDQVNSAFDTYDAMLLEGDTFVNVQDVLERKREYREELALRYNIPEDKQRDFAKASDTKTVMSFATGMIDKNPELVANVLAGDDFDKFKASKEALGQGFSLEEFWSSPELQEEYNSSEYAAKWAKIYQYVDYPTRLALWKDAHAEIARRQKEAVKQKMIDNSMSGWEIDKKRDATIDYINTSGKLPTEMKMPSSVDYTSDPDLGTVGNAIKMGYVSRGKLDKGNSYSKTGLDFAGGISGKLEAKGYKTAITSNVRPKDLDSKHKNGEAVDLRFSDKNGLSIQGTIDGYVAAITQYGNNIPKKGVLLEIRNSDLPKAMQKQLTRPDGSTIDVLDYIKKNMQAQGIDTSWINWEQSKQYREKATGGHVHFTINSNADYTKTNSGKGKKLDFRTPIGAMRYKQKRADGKTVQEAYDAAREDELRIFAALGAQQIISDIVGTKNADGTNLDPAYYGRLLEQRKQKVLASKLSDTDRIIQLEAIAQAEKKIPELQKMFREDTSEFMRATRQGRTPEEAAILQMKQYGISPDNVMMMSNEEAQVKADWLHTKADMTSAVNYVKQNSVNRAALKQIAKYMPDDSKSNLIMYAPMASPSLTSELIACGNDWDAVSKAMQTDKDRFPTNWDSKVRNDFNKHPLVKSYFEDVKKTSPEEASKMLDMMTTMYGYKLYKGATDSKNTVDYIVNNIIGNNFSPVTVEAPRFGKTTVAISKAFSENDLYKVARVSNIINAIGLDDKAIFVPRSIPTTTQGLAAKTAVEQRQIDERHYVDGIVKNSRVSGTPDGASIMFTWEDPTGVNAGSKVLARSNQRPIIVPVRDLIAIYNEAYKLKESWVNKSKYYKSKYYAYGNVKVYNIPGYGRYTTPGQNRESEAMSAAIDHVLTNKYKWLKRTDYTVFSKKLTPVGN